MPALLRTLIDTMATAPYAQNGMLYGGLALLALPGPGPAAV